MLKLRLISMTSKGKINKTKPTCCICDTTVHVRRYEGDWFCDHCIHIMNEGGYGY